MTNEKTDFEKKNSRHGAVLMKNYFYFDIIIFSHLGWQSVYAKSKDAVLRISRDYKILFVEKPVPFDNPGKHGFKTERITPHLSILKPRVRAISKISKILKRLNITEVNLAWFYSPVFVGLLDDISAHNIIYERMNKKGSFENRAQVKFQIEENKLVGLSDLILNEENPRHQSEYASPGSFIPHSVGYERFINVEINRLLPQSA